VRLCWGGAGISIPPYITNEVKRGVGKWKQYPLKAWHLADEIKTKEDVIGILEAALEENDIEFLFGGRT
jgi:hypothetical protein